MKNYFHGLPYIYQKYSRTHVETVSERLCIIMKYIVIRDTQTTLSTKYRVIPPTFGRIIKEVCKGIWKVLREGTFLTSPSNEVECLKIAHNFNKKWNFSHHLGPIDGKDMVFQALV